MPDFHIERTVTGFLLTWDEAQLMCDVSEVHVGTESRLTAWLCFRATAEDPPRLLHEAQYNLGSRPTMQGLAKFMEDLFPLGNWQPRTQEIEHHVRQKSQEGEPLERLDPDGEIPPLEWALYPLLVKGLPNIIFGEGGLGKSLLAMILVACISIPWKHNGLGFTVPERLGCVYLDWEADRLPQLKRWHELKTGMGLEAGLLDYIRCLRPLPQSIGHIVREIDALEPEVLVIDSLAMACGRQDLSDPQTATEFYTVLRQLQKTAIIIAHTSKDQSGKKTVFGSAFFNYYARNVWEMRAGQRESRNVISFGLYHVKDNYTGRFPPMGFKVTFGDNGILVGRQDIKKDPVLATSQYMYIRAQQLLTKRGRMELPEMAIILNVPARSLKSQVHKHSDIFKHFDDGWGVLVEAEDTVPEPEPEDYDGGQLPLEDTPDTGVDFGDDDE